MHFDNTTCHLIEHYLGFLSLKYMLLSIKPAHLVSICY